MVGNGRFTEEMSLNESTAAGKEDERDREEHTWLAALYPLSHFLGFRPRSHPHAPPGVRLDRHSPRFNRWHYRIGVVLSFGLPVSGSTGEVARYRDAVTGEVHLVEMYKDQVGAKVINSLHSLIAAWVLIALLSLVSRSPFFRAHNSPLLIAGFATEAVVTFFSYRVALAQPKNILFGNAISSVIGVALTKAFAQTDYTAGGISGDNWAAAATIVSVAVFSMQMLGCIHPPGAAIALLANINPTEQQMGWYLVPVCIISSLIVIGWALVINNLGGRRWPENWFYLNAFRDPPIIGPEKLAFSNSPVELPRKPEPPAETGFYRQSGSKTTAGRASEATRVGSATTLSPTAPKSAQAALTPLPELTTAHPQAAPEQPQPEQPHAAPEEEGAATSPKSRMIEEVSVSRNNSKGSKKSKRSVIIHINDRRGSGSNIPPVPAVQWRES